MNPKLLYIGMQYDYGDRRRGLSYEHRNFFDSLKRFCRARGWEMTHYDFMERGRRLGRQAMTSELFELATGTNFAYLFAVLFDPSRDPMPEVFSRIGDSGRTRTVHWFCDDHWKFDTYSRYLAPHFHFSCTTAESAVDKYAAAGLADRVIKTQWACNHHLYVPCSVPRDIDLSFVGMPHGNRRQVLATLAAAGIRPEIFGFGWENRPRLPFHRMVRLFSRSRINLNLSNASTDSGQQIKGRNFEIPGAGGFQLSSDAENLTDYYAEDREIAIFRSDEELVDKVRHFLTHETARAAIARSARKRTLAEHTWQHRLEAIFHRVGAERTAPAAVIHETTPVGAAAGVSASATDAPGQPRVSVVIPCYNQARYLPEAIASVTAQTYRPIDVVIVNDGSTDDTSDVARGLIERYPDFSIALIEKDNGGLPAARNTGIAATTGEYWLPLDADDRIAPMFVEQCVRALAALPEAGFAYTDIQHFGDLDTVFRLPAFDAEAMVHRSNIGCVCAVVRRKAWEAVGGYDPSMREGYEDWDFWVGCIEQGWGGVRIARPLFHYRKRGDSMLTDARKKHEALFARIVLNHPSLYSVQEIQAAALTLQTRTRAETATPEAPPADRKPERLTIAYLIHNILGVTGGNQTLLRQVNALVERGHRVHIVTYSDRPGWFDLKADVIRVPAGVPMAGHVPPSDVVIATYFLNAPELIRIEAPVKIYFAQGDQYVFGDDTPLSDASAQAERDRLRRLCAESYILPGIRFVANSHHLAATVRYRYGRLADGILPPCRDQTVFRPLDRHPAPPWRILVVGPDARGSDTEPLTFKGIGDIRAALDLLARRAAPFNVVRMSSTTADIFKGYPCEFHFKPADRKKTEIFGTAHILVYASHYDSCPLPPMEAMAAGAAVVCTVTPGALEYCRHEENALLVPVGAPEAIADALCRIMGDAALYRRLTAGGRATAARFPRELEWDELERMFYRFMAQANAAGGDLHDAKHLIDDIAPSSPGAAVSAMDATRDPSSSATDYDYKEHIMTPLKATPAVYSDADVSIRRIQSLIAADRLDEAVTALNRLLDAQPDHALAHNDLAVLYYRRGDMDRALTHYRRAAEADPENITFQKNLADFLYVERGQVAEALKIFVAILTRQPDDVETLLTTGHICVSQEQFDDAAHFYRRVLAAEPWHADAGRFLDAVERRNGGGGDDPQVIRDKATTLVDSGDAAGALEALKQAAALDPEHADTHCRLGELLWQTGEIDAGRRHLETAAGLAPEDSGIQKNLADFYHVAEGRVADALAIYEAVADAHPEDVNAHLLAGHLNVTLERFEAAETRYRQVIRVEPWHADAGRCIDALERRRARTQSPADKDPDEYHRAALEMAEDGDETGAVRILESIAASHPEHALTHNDLGVLYGRRQQLDRALIHYRKAAALAPTSTVFQKNLADCCALIPERYQEAMEIYVNLLAADPCDVDALLGMGQVCMALNRPSDAGHFFDRVLEAEPWNADARALRDSLAAGAPAASPVCASDLYDQAGQLALAGDVAGALKTLKALTADHPDHAAAHNDLGVLYYRCGDPGQAEKHYARAVALDPSSTVFQKNLADFYAVAMNRYETALEIYVNLLAADPGDVEALMGTGHICRLLARLDDAAHFFQRVLDAEPWHADAGRYLDDVRQQRVAAAG